MRDSRAFWGQTRKIKIQVLKLQLGVMLGPPGPPSAVLWGPLRRSYGAAAVFDKTQVVFLKLLRYESVQSDLLFPNTGLAFITPPHPMAYSKGNMETTRWARGHLNPPAQTL